MTESINTPITRYHCLLYDAVGTVPALPKHVQVVEESYMTSLPLPPPARVAAISAAGRLDVTVNRRADYTRMQNARTTGANDSVDLWDFPGTFS